MSKHKAKIAGLGAAGGTGASLVGATAVLSGPAANLGGYAVAQMLAGSVGLGGPALSLGPWLLARRLQQGSATAPNAWRCGSSV